MASMVINHAANLYIVYTAPAGTLNLSCYATALEITPSTEDVDVGVFCAPAISDQGRTTYSAVLSLLWEPALYDALQPYINRQGKLAFIPDPLDQDKGVEFDTRFAAQPWGRFEVGQRVEVELPLAVLSIPIWNPDRLP